MPCSAASAAETNVTSPTPGTLHTHFTLACAGRANAMTRSKAPSIARTSRFKRTTPLTLVLVVVAPTKEFSQGSIRYRGEGRRDPCAEDLGPRNLPEFLSLPPGRESAHATLLAVGRASPAAVG